MRTGFLKIRDDPRTVPDLTKDLPSAFDFQFHLLFPVNSEEVLGCFWKLLSSLVGQFPASAQLHLTNCFLLRLVRTHHLARCTFFTNAVFLLKSFLTVTSPPVF